MNPDQATEEELLRRWRKAGSAEERRALLERILEPYLGRIARWAVRFSRNPDEAKEVAQDALLAVCSHLDRFRGDSRFSTWVYALVRNHALKRLERAARRRETALDGLPEDHGSADPSGGYEQSLLLERARDLIHSTLTPLEARVFLLHFGLEMPLATVDRELGLTNASGARAYLVSAKRKLRRKIERQDARTTARREHTGGLRRGRKPS